jgi:hypothetical protein
MKKHRTIPAFLLLFLLSFSCFAAGWKAEHSTWRAGVATVVITPQQSLWLAGYASRTAPSEGNIHDLKAKALVLEDEKGTQAVLITIDMLVVNKPFTDRIRKVLKEKHGLSPAQIMISASHTHTGPVIRDALYNIYPLDSREKAKIEKYTDRLEEKIADVVDEAYRRMQPALLYSGTGVTRFQVNRTNNDERTLKTTTSPRGPNDFSVPVLKVTDSNGTLQAVVFGYACHPTVLNINKWSGDYPGFAQLTLEQYHPGVTAMFFQGTGADQNPLPRRSVARAQQYGRELAAAVDRVLTEDMTELSPLLTTLYREIPVPLAEPPSTEELQQIAKDGAGYQQRWARHMLKMRKEGKSFITSYPVPVQIWQLGNQKIITLGGEVVTEYALKLKEMFGDSIFVMSYANDVMAYIPSEKILQERGYEGFTSQMVYGMPAAWDPSLEKVLLKGIVSLARDAGMTVKYPERVIENKLIARRYYSGFDEAHDTYNAISTASDGRIYYVLSSAAYDKGGQMYVYDPVTDSTHFIADLTEVCGEKDARTIAQGKSHVNFQEKDGRLYFATHVGYYQIIDGAECLPVTAPPGYKLYPGGHILSYDLATGTFEDLALAPHGEGIITMTMDTDRGHIYAITWPVGYFLHYDMNTGKLEDLGPVSARGEAGIPGDDYRVLCRSMFVDNRDGSVYYSTAEGDIFRYDPSLDKPVKVEGVDMRKDYFGKYDPTRPGSMGYNWRRIIWYPQEGVAYGVHGNSGYLFRFDPRKPELTLVERITSEPSKKSGMFDQFSYGYLGFELGPDHKTLYYLTGGPVYRDGKRVEGVKEIAMGAARGLENLHLVTYNIPHGEYRDHGAVYYEDGSIPTYVNSIAIDRDGNVYTLARFLHNGKEIEDLIKIPGPF